MGNLRTVGSFTSPIDAHIAKGRLETEGINAYIANENHIWANWMYSNALGGVKIKVAEQHYLEAEEILKKHLEGKYEDALVQEFNDIEENACPSCGAMKFKSTVPLTSVIIVFLTLGLFSIIFNVRKENHKCIECGCKWKY